MDLGRARYRQAHKLPDPRLEAALFVILLLLTLLLAVVAISGH